MSLWSRIKSIFVKKHIDENDLDHLEEILIDGDVGVNATCKIVNTVGNIIKNQSKIEINEFKDIIVKEILKIVDIPYKDSYNFENPYVVLVVGINGVGKTTTIGKLMHIYKQQNRSIVIGACDTFRAAAQEQLQIWADRENVQMISKYSENNIDLSPSTVAYKTIQYAKDNNINTVIIDTAGRLHNKIPLMDELVKIVNTIKKVSVNAPHDTFLVIDASTGQNAYNQVDMFTRKMNISGIIVTKLDGLAKSGFIIDIVNKYQIPIRYIGTGEKIDDLHVFNAYDFCNKLVNI